jgi:hypothetical protein
MACVSAIYKNVLSAPKKRKKKDTHLRASMTPRESGVAEEESCEVLSEFLIVDQR